MRLFQKIMLATDLSPVCSMAFRCFPDMHALGVEEVVLSHAIPPSVFSEIPAAVMEQARKDLERQASHFRQQHVAVRTELVVGEPGRALIEIAEKHGVSLIAVGSRRSGSRRGALIGCTAYSILHETVLPTLLLRLPQNDSTPGGADRNCLQRILFPTDFSETSEKAFLYLEALAGGSGSEVTLYHVHDQTRIDPYLRDRLPEFDRVDRERMERLKQHLMLNGAGECRVELAYGVPAHRLLAMARSRDYGMIVMGAQGRGFIPEVFMGNTANAVARHAPVPVLFVPNSR